MLIALLLLAHSPGVASNPEKLAGWSKDFKDEVIGGSAMEGSLAASWASSKTYIKGKGNVHRLVAQGKAWIATGLYDRGAFSLVSTITTTQRIRYLAGRLVTSRF